MENKKEIDIIKITEYLEVLYKERNNLNGLIGSLEEQRSKAVHKNKIMEEQGIK